MFCICLQTTKLAVGAMTEPVHTSLKDAFRNLLFGCIWVQRQLKSNRPKQSLTQFIVNKKKLTCGTDS